MKYRGLDNEYKKAYVMIRTASFDKKTKPSRHGLKPSVSENCKSRNPPQLVFGNQALLWMQQGQNSRTQGTAQLRPSQLDITTPSEEEQVSNPSVTNEAEPLDDGPDGGAPVPAAPAQAQSPGPSCGNPITWTPKSPIPVDVQADSAAEFLTKMNAALGGNPHMQPSIAWKPFSLDAKGKVDKIDLTLETTIIRARYAGGRPPVNEKTIITEMVDFIKQHEERHRDASREVSQQAVCDALGKTEAEADKTLRVAMCKKEPTAQEAIDAKEGKLELVTGANGAVTGWKAVGITQNYHDPNCK